jgi:hypothetical protein
MSFNPRFLVSAIGTMPFTDIGYAVDLTLRRMPEAPAWPQLPQIGMNEQMEVQIAEGVPCLTIDRERRRIFFDLSGDCSEPLARFYQTYLDAADTEPGRGDFSAFSIGRDFAAGLYALEEALRSANGKPPFVKMQSVGPVSFGLNIKDHNDRASFFDEQLRDVVVRAIAAKCRWQIRRYRGLADRVICFADEPVLSSFGSSVYVSVGRAEVVSMIAEVMQAIRDEGAISGVHCCGNTEWSIPIDANTDIVAFDAFEFGETIALYPEDVKQHLERGGVLAWGAVPTSPAVREQTVQSLAEQLERLMDRLAATGIDRALIAEQAMITPSCGAGTMEPGDAERVFELNHALGQEMRRRHGF